MKIPIDIHECMIEFDSIVDKNDTKDLKKQIIDYKIEPIQLHHSLGQWIRNNWGLWSGSDLSRYFNLFGVKHPDDMSHIILECYFDYVRKIDYRTKFFDETEQERFKKNLRDL